MRIWRITPRAYADEVHRGLGGLHAAGRWHEKGLLIIYASEHAGTALLELLVNAAAAKLAAADYRVIEIRIPDDEIIEVPVEELPADWRAHPHPALTRRLGMEWLQAARSLALSVPSAVFPLERNVLLNPRHARMREVDFAAPRPLEIDPRLVRRVQQQ